MIVLLLSTHPDLHKSKIKMGGERVEWSVEECRKCSKTVANRSTRSCEFLINQRAYYCQYCTARQGLTVSLNVYVTQLLDQRVDTYFLHRVDFILENLFNTIIYQMLTNLMTFDSLLPVTARPFCSTQSLTMSLAKSKIRPRILRYTVDLRLFKIVSYHLYSTSIE